MNKLQKNYSRLNPTFIISLSMIATVFVSFSLFQQSYAEDYKLNIAYKE